MKKLNNVFLYVALLCFLTALLQIFSSGYINKISSIIFFLNFVLNMNLAFKKRNGKF